MSDLQTPTFTYPIKHLVLSHSTSSSYRSCARRGIEFKKVYGATAVELDEFGNEADNFAADCGKALHEGFQDYLVNGDENKALKEMLMKYPFQTEQMQENRYRSMEACISTLNAMFRHEIVGRYELIYVQVGDEKRPAVEVAYVIEITDSPMPIPVYHVGLIDCILYDRVDQIYIVVDIKTHRDNTNDLSSRYEFDEQTVPYGLVLEHILGHRVQQFKVAYLSCYIDLMEPKIRLYDFIKGQDAIRDWFLGQCVDIKHIAYYFKNQWFPRATSGSVCMAFRKRCAYLDLCAYREPKVLSQLIQGTPRETLFHDGVEPWISVQLPYAREIVGE